MEDEKKTVQNLEQIFSAGDAWLRKYGLVTSVAHNAIVTNLYVNFPKVRYLEYFLPEVSGRRKVWVRLYVPFWKLVFTKRERMVDEVIDFLREYLDGYDIQVELKRYRRGVERSDEVPEKARELILSDDPGGSGGDAPPDSAHAAEPDRPRPSEGAPEPSGSVVPGGEGPAGDPAAGT